MKNKAKIPSSFGGRALRWIFISIAVSTIILCTLISYGSNALFPAALILAAAGSYAAYTYSKRLGACCGFYATLIFGLWIYDASLDFPILRKIQSSIPFGPAIKAYPSPSGKSTAYVYDYGFLDSAYSVKFSRKLWFPDQQTWMRSDKADFSISCRWHGDKFIASTNSYPFTVIYSETTNEIETTQ